MNKRSKAGRFFVMVLAMAVIFSFAGFTDCAQAAGPLKLKAKSAILMDANTGEILYEKNADERLRPASMTKMMTAILVVENLDLEEEVPVSLYATTIGGSALGVKKGDKIKVKDLLGVMLVYSANDCAVVLGEAVSGSVEEFAKLMNKRAKELGCTNTTFKNPNGLDMDGHKSTARDMALIAKKAMEYDTIAEIAGSGMYTIGKTHKRKKKVTVGTTNRILYDKWSWINVNGESRHPYYKYAVGIKTGYTDLAGGCLACMAVKGNEKYITVVMKSTAFDRFADTIEIMEYAFKNFDLKKAVKKGDALETPEVAGGEESTVEAVASGDLYVTEGTEGGYEIETSLNEEIKAPIAKGDELGGVSVVKDGKTLSTAKLLAASDVEQTTFAKLMEHKGFISAMIIAVLAVILLLLLMIRSSSRKRRRRARR